jgi:hypothetical protein
MRIIDVNAANPSKPPQQPKVAGIRNTGHFDAYYVATMPQSTRVHALSSQQLEGKLDE